MKISMTMITRLKVRKTSLSVRMRASPAAKMVKWTRARGRRLSLAG